MPLGDAGAVVFTVTREGARLVDVEAAPGWQVVQHHPSGFFARRRPASWLALSLRAGEGPAACDWEFELERRDDGTWYAAVLEAWPGAAEGLVESPGGRLWTRTEGDRLVIAEVEPRGGWDARTETYGDDQVVAVFRDERGGGDFEEWEVTVALGDEHTPTRLERDHRWRYQPLIG